MQRMCLYQSLEVWCCGIRDVSILKVDQVARHLLDLFESAVRNLHPGGLGVNYVV